MRNGTLGMVFVAGISPWTTSCSGTGEIPTCVVAADADVRPLQDEVCSHLEISNLSTTNLNGLLPYTTAGSVSMYDNGNLVDVDGFLSEQKDLASLYVVRSPLRDELAVRSERFDTLSLEETNVRDITVTSETFSSLYLVNNPVDSISLVSVVLDLLVDGSQTSTLDVFDGITTLNRLIVRNTGIATTAIQAFAELQNDDIVLIHCGNADDAACE